VVRRLPTGRSCLRESVRAWQGEGGGGKERGVGDGVSLAADDASGASTLGIPALRFYRGGGGTRR
jgi:hypothetical protein